MKVLAGEVRNVLDAAEILTIGTCGDGDVHLVATWDEYVRNLEATEEDVLLVPAGGYRRTEQNLANNPRLEVLIASKASGTGFRLVGRGELQTAGPWAQRVKEEYKWARAAMVIYVQGAEKLL